MYVRYTNQNVINLLVGGEGRETRGPRGDRGDYRRKEGGANGDFKPEFRGGLGKFVYFDVCLWIENSVTDMIMFFLMI